VSFPSLSMAQANDRYDGPDPIPNPWLTFNRQLRQDATAFPNEALLARRWASLGELDIDDRRIYWLTVARLCELVLKLAGDYADSCEFQAAGDLLVNPRRVIVYRHGCPLPIVKDRHRALSDQFSMAIGEEHPVDWLKRETQVAIRCEALLPRLKGLLWSSDFMTPAYLGSLERRMCRIADTIALVAAWSVRDSGDLLRRMEVATAADRELLTAGLCRFGLDDFHAMDDDIRAIICSRDDGGRYLKHLRVA
jgi:hypothetical protein